MKKDALNYTLSPVSSTEAETLNDRMDKFIADQVSFQGELEVFKDFVIKDNGNIIAGIRSCFYLGKCLVINNLFVDENHRHKGLGSLLLNKLETEAKSMGAKLIHLDTFDFQAKDFYVKQGYEIFGVLEDCPPDHKRYYMKKVL
jgi:GNAT superfamily N-acetyltransferase